MLLRAFRVQAKMSRRDCAEWLSVSVRTLIRWELGQSLPLPDTQRKIKRLTRGHVTPDDWLNGHKPRRPAL